MSVFKSKKHLIASAGAFVVVSLVAVIGTISFSDVRYQEGDLYAVPRSGIQLGDVVQIRDGSIVGDYPVCERSNLVNDYKSEPINTNLHLVNIIGANIPFLDSLFELNGLRSFSNLKVEYVLEDLVIEKFTSSTAQGDYWAELMAKSNCKTAVAIRKKMDVCLAVVTEVYYSAENEQTSNVRPIGFKPSFYCMISMKEISVMSKDPDLSIDHVIKEVEAPYRDLIKKLSIFKKRFNIVTVSEESA